MAKKTFTVEVTMNERWVDDFCSMLKYMEYCGNAGHSDIVGFFSDGDGDYRPSFDIHTDYKLKHGRFAVENELPDLDVIFDAE